MLLKISDFLSTDIVIDEPLFTLFMVSVKLVESAIMWLQASRGIPVSPIVSASQNVSIEAKIFKMVGRARAMICFWGRVIRCQIN